MYLLNNLCTAVNTGMRTHLHHTKAKEQKALSFQEVNMISGNLVTVFKKNC